MVFVLVVVTLGVRSLQEIIAQLVWRLFALVLGGDLDVVLEIKVVVLERVLVLLEVEHRSIHSLVFPPDLLVADGLYED